MFKGFLITFVACAIALSAIIIYDKHFRNK